MSPVTFAVRGPVELPTASSAMSLVLVATSTQYLTRTFVGSAPTDNKKATIAFFLKRSSIGALTQLYDGGNWDGAGSSISGPDFNGSDLIRMIQYSGGGPNDFTVQSTETVADTTTWHHLCFRLDTTQATDTNRIRAYLDGVEVSYGSSTYIPQNQSLHLTDDNLIGGNPVIAGIGRSQWLADRYVDGKLAYFYFIDGQALTPSSFTTGTGSGTTHPASYGGSFGINGFYLNFSGSNTNDQSGNANNWTQNGSPTFSADIPT